MARGFRAAEVSLPYGSDDQIYYGRDQIVYLSNVSWEDYDRIDALRQERSVPRLTYVEGVLELMCPGAARESDKKMLARIVEAYLDHLGIPAEGVGSWTVKNKRKKLGAEADECYVLTKGPVSPSVKVPDLVIEVVHSSGSLDKLDVWQKLGAKEVWFWRRGVLEVFARKGDARVARQRARAGDRARPRHPLHAGDDADRRRARAARGAREAELTGP